jgi:hypothetical protein
MKGVLGNPALILGALVCAGDCCLLLPIAFRIDSRQTDDVIEIEKRRFLAISRPATAL